MALTDARRSTFGALLRQHRLKAGLTQEALAELARMSVEGIGALERGNRQTPYRATITLLAQALELSPSAAAHLAASATRAPQPRGSIRGDDLAGDRAAHNLSLPASRFLGRQREVGDLLALLEAERIVTLTGIGGIGKTRAALEVATRVVGHRDDGVWFVNLAPVTDSALITRAVASALRMRITGDGPELAQLASAARRLNTLIVLDNCEHLVAGAAEVAESLIRNCPGISFLVTSREPLAIPGEQVYRLPSLDVPARDASPSARDAQSYSAVALFVDRARSADSSFVLTAETASTAALIVRRLDGIPLAIELAAARVRSLGVNALAERLDRRFALLTTNSHTALPRHQTLRAAFDWGHELLVESERILFARLAIFSGGWTLDAAEDVCADASCDVIDAMGSLVEKCLIIAETVGDSGDMRYRLLESTRAYAWEKLIERAEQDELAGRHARWVCAFAQHADEIIHRQPLRRWLATVEPEADNVRAALIWAIDHADYVLAGRLASSFLGFWLEHAQSEGRRWVDAALAGLDPTKHPGVVAHLMLASCYLTDGNNSIEKAQRAIALLDSPAHARPAARAYYGLAVGLLQTARFAEAAAAAERALELNGDAGLTRTRWFCHALLAKGMAQLELQRPQETRACYEAALELSELLGDEEEVARAHMNLAGLEFYDGNTQRALELVLHVRSLPGLTSFIEGPALLNSAGYLLALGDAPQAESAARAALVIFRRVQQPYMAVHSLVHLAAARALQGELRRSGRLFGFANAWLSAQGCEWPDAESRSHELLAAELRRGLTPDKLASVASAGARLDADQAIDEALAVERP